ncbi:hypothetical protein JCM8547_000065 [Rhodosporidiobolus lusitaniae]
MLRISSSMPNGRLLAFQVSAKRSLSDLANVTTASSLASQNQRCRVNLDSTFLPPPSTSSRALFTSSLPSVSLPQPRQIIRRSLATVSTPPVAPLIPFRTHLSPSPPTPTAHTFFHPADSTWTYVVVDPATSHCVIIDSTLDFDLSTNTVTTSTADALLAFVEEQGYKVERILETHAHADHLTAAAYLKARLATTERPEGPPVGISSGISTTADHFGRVYEVDPRELEGAFDELYEDGAKVRVGRIEGEVLSLPGHTPCSAAFRFGDYVFVGDTIFLPNLGSARADFPSGSASLLYTSSQKLLSLPPSTRLFSGHHYPSATEENVCSATVAEQRELNKHLKEGVKEEEYVRMREERDRELSEPRLLHQSLQVNIRGGRLPRGKDGRPYLRTFLTAPAVI